MEVFEEFERPLTLQLKSRIVFCLTSGALYEIKTPLSPEDFVIIWNSGKRHIKIATGLSSFVEIDKRRVELYDVTPIEVT